MSACGEHDEVVELNVGGRVYATVSEGGGAAEEEQRIRGTERVTG
jgi:hypothetical protein